MSAVDAFWKRYGLKGSASSDSGGDGHEHHASEISGAFDSVTVIGDIWSTNWDGAVPADLSAGPDTTATQGFYLDSSTGVIQVMGIEAEGGNIGNLSITDVLTLSGSGKVVTAASGQRIEITSGKGYAVDLYSGNSNEDTPGSMWVWDTVAAIGTSIAAPTGWSAGVSAVLQLFTTNSESRAYLLGPLASFRIEAPTLPVTDNTYDLGNATLSWRALYVYDIYDEDGTQVLGTKGGGSSGMYAHVDLDPSTDNARDLGDATNTWRNVYAYGVYDESGNEALDTSDVVGAEWTPTLSATTTPPTLGTGSVTKGRSQIVGGRAHASVTWKFGTSPNAGNGEYQFTLPYAVDTTYHETGGKLGSAIGHGYIIDDSGSARYLVTVLASTGTVARIKYQVPTTPGLGNVTFDTPFTWAANDTLTLSLEYWTSA